MAITVSGTSITFNDSTTQTTAFTGSSVPALNAVGSVQVMMVTQSTVGTVIKPGDSISGSYVFYQSAGIAPNSAFYPGNINGSGQSFNLVNRTTAFTYAGGAGATYTPTSGTWRALQSSSGGYYDGCGISYATPLLLIRIA